MQNNYIGYSSSSAQCINYEVILLKILLAQFAILQRNQISNKDIHSTRLSTDNHLYCHCIGNLMIEQSNRKNDAQGVGNSITKNFNVLLHF